MRTNSRIPSKIVAAVAVALLSSGCSTVQKPEHLNYFFVNPEGDVVNPITSKPYETGDDEGQALRSIIQSDRNTIMIYIHGGLNTEENAIERANDMQKVMDKEKVIHPIFINWRSGPFTSYAEHLFFHRQGERWNVAGPLTFPFVFLEDLGRALSRSPKTLVNTLNTYRKTYEFDYTNSGANAYKLESAAVRSEYFGSLTPKNDERGSGDIVWNHATSTVSHAVGLFGNILMDFAGTGSWDVMKRRAELMFEKSRPEENNGYDGVPKYTELRKGGVNNFLKELKAYMEKPENAGKKILLVGHSMGTIIANKILTSQPNIEYDRIVYMGAACSIRDFQASVIPYLVKNPKSEFYNYTLDPLAENLEAGYLGIGGTGSLLVQIDNIYERPVAENQRTLGRWENVMNGLNYFDVDNNGLTYRTLSPDRIKDLKKRIHLRTIPFDKNSPTKHGEFDDVSKMNPVNGYFWDSHYHEKLAPPETHPLR